MRLLGVLIFFGFMLAMHRSTVAHASFIVPPECAAYAKRAGWKDRVTRKEAKEAIAYLELWAPYSADVQTCVDVAKARLRRKRP